MVQILSQRSQFVRIDLDKSLSHELNCGVPQGSVLDPVLYVLYTSPVADILQRHNMAFHLYADDTQLYVSFSFDDDLGLQCTMSNTEKCLNDIHLWMTANKLKLNKDKTELIYFYSKYSPQKFLSHFISVIISSSLPYTSDTLVPFFTVLFL